MQNKEFGMHDNSEFDDKKFIDLVTSTNNFIIYTFHFISIIKLN